MEIELLCFEIWNWDETENLVNVWVFDAADAHKIATAMGGHAWEGMYGIIVPDKTYLKCDQCPN